MLVLESLRSMKERLKVKLLMGTKNFLIATLCDSNAN